MIDRVEFTFFDHVAHVGDLEAGKAVLLEEDGKPFDEVVYLVDMGGNIVGDDDICKITIRRKPTREGRAEECLYHRNPKLPRRRGRARRRIDPDHRNASCYEVAEQIAVVAC